MHQHSADIATWPALDNKEHAGASGLPRLPAAESEAAVLEQLRGVVRAPEMVGDVVARAAELDSTWTRRR